MFFLAIAPIIVYDTRDLRKFFKKLLYFIKLHPINLLINLSRSKSKMI